jgi:hypothetical protein
MLEPCSSAMPRIAYFALSVLRDVACPQVDGGMCGSEGDAREVCCALAGRLSGARSSRIPAPTALSGRLVLVTASHWLGSCWTPCLQTGRTRQQSGLHGCGQGKLASSFRREVVSVSCAAQWLSSLVRRPFALHRSGSISGGRRRRHCIASSGGGPRAAGCSRQQGATGGSRHDKRAEHDPGAGGGVVGAGKKRLCCHSGE